MKRSAVFLVAVMLLAGDRAVAQDRGGFTFLVGVGVGVQNDTSIEETEVGLAGINFGVGGFATPDVAIMFRQAGTNVNYDLAGDVCGGCSGCGGCDGCGGCGGCSGCSGCDGCRMCSGCRKR